MLILTSDRRNNRRPTTLALGGETGARRDRALRREREKGARSSRRVTTA